MREFRIKLETDEIVRLQTYCDELNRQAHGRPYDLLAALTFLVHQELRPRATNDPFWAQCGCRSAQKVSD